MLMILLACAGVPGCGFFTWLMGLIGNHTGGLQAAFYLVPACFFTLTVLIAYDRWRPLPGIGGGPAPDADATYTAHIMDCL